MFINITDLHKGPKVMDLSLLLNMYLPAKKWAPELAKEIISEYSNKVKLSTNEKYLLLAQLCFPRRFWLYAYRYFKSDDGLGELTEKFKNYLYESYWQEKCLEELENWMLGE
jgi:Ser/Thr protein kinase RdoA (MazF antagonist)